MNCPWHETANRSCPACQMPDPGSNTPKGGEAVNRLNRALVVITTPVACYGFVLAWLDLFWWLR